MLGRIKARVTETVRSWRARRPWFDHIVRAYDRNSEVLGNQLAGAITYFGFLSFFPLLALGFSLVGYISDVYPSAQDDVTQAVQDAFPSLIGDGEGQINVQDIIDARAGTGVIALLGLLYAGMGWLDALRDGLRRVFATADVPIGLLRKKLVDVVVLVLLGASLLGSLVVTSMATAATTFVLDQVGLEETPAAVGLLKVISVAFAIAADTVLFAILLSRLSGAQVPWRRVRSGALLGAIGFELLKLLGTFLLGRTTANPLYATFGVVVGLLVWMNFVARLTIFAAAWTATEADSLEPVVARGDDEPEPVAAPQARVRAGTSRRRRAAVGAAAGVAATAWLTRRRRNR